MYSFHGCELHGRSFCFVNCASVACCSIYQVTRSHAGIMTIIELSCESIQYILYCTHIALSNMIYVQHIPFDVRIMVLFVMYYVSGDLYNTATLVFCILVARLPTISSYQIQNNSIIFQVTFCSMATSVYWSY